MPSAPSSPVSAPPPDRLIFANSETCPDLYYACRFLAPDPFAWVRVKGHTAVLLSSLEVDRGRSQARVERVDALADYQPGGAHPGAPSQEDYAQTLARWLAALGAAQDLETPADFPLGLARKLEALGYRLHPVADPFWPERETKTEEEISALRRALRLTEAGLARALEVLRATRIGRDGQLRWAGRILLSETLRAEIDTAVLRAGGQPTHTIVAGGEQACDPHERGSGPLRAGQLIILDVFPRDSTSGYFGDLTRTVVRGPASEAVRTLWKICEEGQKQALAAIRPGRSGAEIHEQIVHFFARSGFPTEVHQGRWRGFFHGTGHGLGLAVHEHPRFSATTFREGQVLTVEPGLYWPGVGGVRHEDVIVVRPEGAEMLSDFPKPLEL